MAEWVTVACVESSDRKLRSSRSQSVALVVILTYVVVMGMENWEAGDALRYKQSLISKLDKNREKCNAELVS